tara:strand:+ start:148 stop:1872 length:1725 start_codon:yes stop_codon:yes gene_type:complete
MEKQVQRALLTYAAFSYIVFTLALFHIANKFSLIASALLLIFFYCFHVRNSSDVKLKKEECMSLLVVFILIFLLFSHVFFIPPYMRDDIIYHLIVPKNIAQSGHFNVDIYNINSNFPMLFEMPLTVTELFNEWLSPFIINYVMLILLGIFYYAVARKQFGVSYNLALFSIPLMISTPVLYDLLHSSYVEIFFTLLILATFHNYLKYIEERKENSFYYLTMLFAGLACSTKYLGMPFALFIIVMEFFLNSNRRQYYLGLSIFILPALPWYLKNWILLGNPTYPLLNWLFESPHLSTMRVTIFDQMAEDYNMGRSFLDYTLLPIKLLVGIDVTPKPGEIGFGGKLSIFFILSFLGMGFKERKIRIITLLFAMYSLLWAIYSQQVRFLLPTMILSSLCGLGYLEHRWEKYKPIILILVLVIMVQNLYNIGSAMKEEKIWDLLTKKMDKESFLVSHMPYSYGMAGKINSILNPETDKILTVGNFGRNYYFEIPVITNTYYDVEIFDKAFKKGHINFNKLEQFLNREGITHIMLNMEYYRKFHSMDSSVDFSALKQYFNQMMKVVFSQNSFTLYKYGEE